MKHIFKFISIKFSPQNSAFSFFLQIHFSAVCQGFNSCGAVSGTGRTHMPKQTSNVNLFHSERSSCCYWRNDLKMDAALNVIEDRFFPLREQQCAIIKMVLDRRSVFGILPTGFGKSACFYLPPLIKKIVRICKMNKTSIDFL